MDQISPELIAKLQGSLGSLVGQQSGYIKSLPEPVKRRIFALKQLQAEHSELEAQFHKDILELEKKYLGLYTPLYEKRNDIVVGKTEPSDDQVEAGKKIDEEFTEEIKESSSEAEIIDEAQSTAGVPEFWLSAMKNHAQIADMITEQDQEALKSLTNIRLAYLEENPGFKLEFDFSENEYFNNTVLTKTYYYQQSATSGDLVFDHAEGTVIEWKEGKDLSVTIETKKQRHKSTNKTRVVKRTVPAETFFNFFTPIEVPDAEDLDENEENDIGEQLEADYELGEEFKEKLIPHAIDWFTGKALEYEGFGLDDYDDEDDYYEDNSDEQDDDDDDDDDDEEEEYSSAPANQQAPECKQQ
ncbi:NAP-domain-containing protein [Basidiobolus meristosporus CBS 931.73]|uniref:NAP-domain-containing protein n=1 Tax=Basidiobolus meristosporus CBS 931.73 TaxID=1314790 RepID=A0A1Y1YIZ6_9FUNG|nr:NAP-domain-containing protein [Basidiobolus meristosporus CBS 931.73]|eukprot:ORX97726.1 NAP-domain-containing protein [Basidiobolus meristosporus CBS 931.73]